MWYQHLLIVFVSFSEGLLKSDLIHPEWQEVISAGGMHIGYGRNKRFVGLNETQPNTPHQACFLPNGKAGHCRHLQYCIQEDFRKDFMKFMDYLCIIQYSSMGVCCPEDHIYDVSTAMVGNIPSIATRNESEVSSTILRSENRGCGLTTNPQGRMTGAIVTDPGEWPWMVFLAPEGFVQWCGGSLITDRHVLSAAHCTYGYTEEELFVRLGEYDLMRTNYARSHNFQVIEKREHEYFEVATYHNDIVILKLNSTAVFNAYVWPICLPPPGLQLENENATVIGWGTLWYTGPISQILMEVSVSIWPLSKCIRAFTDTIFNENLCANTPKGERDSCQGDSGGPLMYQLQSGRWVVVGVVSWGIRCGEPMHPGIYTSVDKYLPWILGNTIF